MLRARAFVAALACCGAAPLTWAEKLPSLPPASEAEREVVTPRFVLRKAVVSGVTVIPSSAIASVTRRFEGKPAGEPEWRTLAEQLTALYTERGYPTSGVRFTSADSATGEARFEAIEGPVSQVRFTRSPTVANPAWLTRQLVPDPSAPARLDEIQARMAGLRDAGVIDRINASLEPLPGVGRSELVVTVEEPRPWSVAIDYDNYHSPAVGARRPSLSAAHRNLTGWGDRADLRVGKTQGLEDVSASWMGTLPRTSILAGFRFERSDALAIDPPAFRELDIKTLSETRGADLGWRFTTEPSRNAEARLAFDRRRSTTSLLGLPFSFIVGLPDGEAKADVVRAIGVWTKRGENEVLFLRGQASAGKVRSGLEPLPEAPASRFTAWFAQGQYARRLTSAGVQWLARLEGQYTPDRLLPIEKYSIGGHATVRGYRENLVIRDRAVLGSTELRAPIARWGDTLRLEGGAFIDAAWSANVGSLPDSLPATLASAGVSAIVHGPAGLSARLDVAVPSRRNLTPNADWQDRGIHFRVTWNADRALP